MITTLTQNLKNTFPRQFELFTKFFKFGIVGSIGTVINTLILFLLTNRGMYYLLASAIATEIAIISNFIGNQIFTFKGHIARSFWKKFTRFQAISMFSLLGTVFVLWVLTSMFGIKYLLVWNLIAILAMFVVNFSLNNKFTWGTTKSAFVFVFLVLMLTTSVHADFIAVGQIGYHPNSAKQAIMYTHNLNGTFEVLNEMNTVVMNGSLVKAQDYLGNDVECQGNNPCLVGDFTNITVPGTYRVIAGGEESLDFIISHDTYADNVGVFFEFFDALQQQGSTYHGDFHGAYDPPFTIMADGSFIMESHQAALTLIRLGSAYRTNPALFQGTTLNKHIKQYADYLISIQGLEVEERTDGVGFRLNTNVEVINAFVPGETTLVELNIYPGNNLQINLSQGQIHFTQVPPTSELFVGNLSQGIIVTNQSYTVPNGNYTITLVRLGHDPFTISVTEQSTVATTTVQADGVSIDISIPLGTSDTFLFSMPIKKVPVVSLCGDLSGSEYDTCIDHAATFYKCQENEPCLNMSYIEKTGVITSHDNGYGISRGWGVEFGCAMDVHLDGTTFNDSYNPCQIFLPETSVDNTVEGLFALLQALPAVNDMNEDEGFALFTRIIKTYNYTEETYNTATLTDSSAGFYGAALFLLYNYTGNDMYLTQAHSMRTQVPIIFVSDKTSGSEFYWEEYIRNKEAILKVSLEYNYAGDDPSELFRGKMYGDYQTGPTAMSKTAERVFQFDNNIRFQNSRYMLTEGVIAAKTLDLHENPEEFIRIIAEAQLFWLTGMNAVQNGTSIGTNTMSKSFIFGIGNHPSEFHSRYLVDTGYKTLSLGQIIGARGTSLLFFNGTDHIYLDGKADILGYELGGMGNGYMNEVKTELFQLHQTFNNGKTFIPGWINGAFDIPEDTDTIFNYDDDIQTYQFTETTNEIVATAIELFAYLDSQNNGRQRHTSTFFNESDMPPSNGTLRVTTMPGNATVHFNVTTLGRTDPGSGELIISWAPGIYDTMIIWPGTLYVYHNESVEILPGSVTTIIASVPGIENGTFVFNITPGNATVYVEGREYFTDESGSLNLSVSPGTYDVMIGIADMPYTVYSENLTITEAETHLVNVELSLMDAFLELNTEPNGADVFIDGTFLGQTPFMVFDVLPDVEHTINVTKLGYMQNGTTFTPFAGEFVSINLTLQEISSTVLSSTINVPEENGSYTILETNTVDISLELDMNATVNWTVNGEQHSITNNTNAQFSWSPGIFYVEENQASEDNTNATAVITATLGEEVLMWTIIVRNEINPFFENTLVPNSVTAVTLHVFTYNQSVNFTEVTVTIETNGGAVKKNYSLAPNPTLKGEVDWNIASPAAVGTNELTLIIARNNETGITKTYTVENRGFFREFPSGGNDDTRTSTGGGGGGGGGIVLEDPDPPEVVYVLFENDVVSFDDTQHLKLDAKIGFGDSIKSVQARILKPNGESETFNLELIAGTNTYGTWETSFTGFEIGRYILSFIDIETNEGLSERFKVRNTHFYASKDTESANFNIVYALLDKSEVEQGTPVLLTLDASDRVGIRSAHAIITISDGEGFTLPLELVTGDSSYGTWQATIETEKGDVTYTVGEILLERSETEQQKVSIEKRSVYVSREEIRQESLITGNVIGTGLSEVIKNPLIPTLAGFSLMIIIMGLVLFSSRLRARLLKH